MKKFLLALPLVVLTAAGCASASAKGRSETPGLTIPPAPSRVVDPPPEPDPEPVADLPTVAPVSPSSTTAPRPNRGRESRPPAADPKATEQKPVEATPPDPAPVPQPAAPPAQLQTPQAADTNAVRAVRATIDRTNGLLNGVNYGPLSDVRKKAYDDARRFIQQAEGALREGNIVFAQGVATKAETLAKELAGR